ncbi:MAG TPA: dethiobiotin synthase [Polyangiaceae bacterium]|nr:dethiobiotin synthase [Polyangiaceae bacterium]
MRVVILGTGTSVGKTFVTAALAAACRSRGSVLALKPIETGVLEGAPGDAGTIAEAAGHSPVLSRWRFERGVSPHLAAREQGESIDIGQVAGWVWEHEQRLAPAVTLVESAGGAFTPLGPRATNVDLASSLAPALWLLVAPDALGVLHDVGAALRALPRPPDAVVLSAARPVDASSGSNAAELKRLGICKVMQVLAAGSRDVSGLAAWLTGLPKS